jgi:hypothetical protein
MSARILDAREWKEFLRIKKGNHRWTQMNTDKDRTMEKQWPAQKR